MIKKVISEEKWIFFCGQTAHLANDISSPEVIGKLVQLWRPCRVVQLVVGVDVQSLWHDAWPSIQEARLKLLRWRQVVLTFIVHTTVFNPCRKKQHIRNAATNVCSKAWRNSWPSDTLWDIVNGFDCDGGWWWKVVLKTNLLSECIVSKNNFWNGPSVNCHSCTFLFSYTTFYNPKLFGLLTTATNKGPQGSAKPQQNSGLNHHHHLFTSLPDSLKWLHIYGKGMHSSCQTREGVWKLTSEGKVPSKCKFCFSKFSIIA